MFFSYTKSIELWLFLSVSTLILITNNVILHILLYNFVAFFLVFSISKTYDSFYKRVCGTFIYCFILSVQVGFLLTRDLNSDDRLIAVIMLIPAFIIEYLFLKYETEQEESKFHCLETPPVTVKETIKDTISFSELKMFSKKINQSLQRVRDSGEIITAETVRDVMSDLPRNCSISYVNKSSLSEEYLENLDLCLEDQYIYIVLSDTGSPASSLIGVISQKTYNHVSIAFDEDLKTLISYNGGERITPPGLNAEMIEWLFKKHDASIMIYRLKVTRHQKERMMFRIREIDEDGSAYNLIGLALKKSFKSKPNIMFCSQFVYNMLEEVGLNYFDKKPSEIKPTDLVELDYERKLEFVQKICLFSDEEVS